MVWISASGDGWVNLLPGVPSEVLDDQPRPTILSALFGATQPPVTMCTWMPPRPGGSEVTVGILHPHGRRAAAQLAAEGVPVPGGWRVRQDNGRRGLIVAAPAATPHDQVLDWTLAAGAALARVPLTGRWQARVYLPLVRSTAS